MLYSREANGTIEEVSEKINTAATANKFGVLGVHDLKQKMAAKGVDFGPECRVFEVCSPLLAKELLTLDLSVSTVLPCRISLYQDGSKVKVAAISPTALIALFNNQALELAAKKAEQAIINIIDQACS